MKHQIKTIKDLCDSSGFPVREYDITSLPPSGSQRRYFRVAAGNFHCVACISEDREENETFIRLSRYFKDKGLSVPEIYAVSEDAGCYLLEDLGATDLMGALLVECKPWPLIEDAIRGLVSFQWLPEGEWKDLVGFPPFDAGLVRFDLNYAFEHLIIPFGIKYSPTRMEEEFRTLERRLLRYPKELCNLMYRDFQSRNIMLGKDGVCFIDYQSARKGPGIYDLVSFAWQAKAGFSPEERLRIVKFYAAIIENIVEGAFDAIMENMKYWAAFRIIQTLGAYGRRGIKEGKPHFIQSIPLAVGNFLQLAEENELDAEFPELSTTIGRLVSFL